jgi:hypothetical protein
MQRLLLTTAGLFLLLTLIDARNWNTLPIYPVRQQPRMIMRIVDDDADQGSSSGFVGRSARQPPILEKRQSSRGYDTMQQLLVLDRLLKEGR